jgi:hypothetical protein
MAKISSPNIPHRIEHPVHEGFSLVSFSRDACLEIWASLSCKRTKLDSPDPTVIYESMKPLNQTNMLIKAIRRRSAYTSQNQREGLSESERKKIHHTISTQAGKLHDLLAALDRDVFHDWCDEGYFLKKSEPQKGESSASPDYKGEQYLFDLVGQLVESASKCASKTREELSANTGNQNLHTGIDIAVDAIATAYIKITPAKITTGSPTSLSPFEHFSIKCIEKMGFRGVSEDSLRHIIRQKSAGFIKK